MNKRANKLFTSPERKAAYWKAKKAYQDRPRKRRR
jgi:hypothetical protein